VLELLSADPARTKTQAFIASKSTISEIQHKKDLEAIEQLLDRLESDLHIPIDNLCSRAEAYHDSPELLTSICTMVRLSRLLLHASIVPLLSGTTPNSSLSRVPMQEHVKLVLEQAVAYAQLLHEFVARDVDMTRL
jgi:hypothetical protein